jgi:DNA-binding transcriptional ArsR family regulator
MLLNIKTRPATRKVSRLLQVIHQPARLEILLAIGSGEACVCHLEACLGKRQAYISQHLMALRQAGIVTARRDGRNVYYRLTDPALLELIQKAAFIAGFSASDLAVGEQGIRLPGCPCPHCASEDVLVQLEDIEQSWSPVADG